MYKKAVKRFCVPKIFPEHVGLTNIVRYGKSPKLKAGSFLKARI
jgi:hypothetical protein